MQSGFRQRVNQREDVEKPTAGAAQAAKKNRSAKRRPMHWSASTPPFDKSSARDRSRARGGDGRDPVEANESFFHSPAPHRKSARRLVFRISNSKPGAGTVFPASRSPAEALSSYTRLWLADNDVIQRLRPMKAQCGGSTPSCATTLCGRLQRRWAPLRDFDRPTMTSFNDCDQWRSSVVTPLRLVLPRRWGRFFLCRVSFLFRRTSSELRGETRPDRTTIKKKKRKRRRWTFAPTNDGDDNRHSLDTHTHTHTRRAPLLKSRPAAFRPFVDAPSLFRLFLTFVGAEEQQQQQQQQEGKKNRKNGPSHRQKSLRTCCRRRRRRRRPSAVGRPSSDGRRRRPWLRFQPKQNGGLKISIKKKRKKKSDGKVSMKD